MRNSFIKKRIQDNGIYLAIVVILIGLLFPFAVMISTSLKSLPEIYEGNPHWIPDKLMWMNFIEVWDKIALASYFKNSILISLGATAFSVGISLPAAYALARIDFPGKKAMLFLLLVAQMFSPIIIIISIFKLMSSLDLVDSILSLIIINGVFTLSFTIWLMNGYFAAIPIELEEAAKIDGCSRLSAFFRIILPISKPGIVTVVIFAFITTWNEFMFAFTMTSTPENMPLTSGLFRLVGKFSTQWQYLMAASILTIIPVILLFMYIEKNLVSGLTSGAVKG
jgi:multiple sugar transport system permease protein